MPIEFVPVAKMPLSKRNRKSKIESSPEWAEITKAIQKGFSKDTSIRLTLTPATEKLFKAGRAAHAFVIRLRKQFQGYQIRMIQGEIWITLQKSAATSTEAGKS
jgi:hypothetical protein